MELQSASLARLPRTFARGITRGFPTPAYLTVPAAGVDISDASIKWLLFKDVGGLEVASFGEEKLEAGIVTNGTIQNVHTLSEALLRVRDRLGATRFAHAALPEEAAYVFETSIPVGTSRAEARDLVEFEFEGRVPISPNQAVFDFDVIRKDTGEGDHIGVSVFPRELAESYVAAFDAAGLPLLSLELEARSIARAITPEHDDSVVLLVDFGRARTGFAVLKRGIPIFTSTVEVGGDAITSALAETMSLSYDEAIAFRNEHGLAPGTDKKGLDAIAGVASALSDEVARHYHYWDTRRNERGERVTPVSKVVLVGGSANLRGLPDYIAGRVQAEAHVGNVWERISDFGRTVPPIDKRASLQYATAIGLALRSYL